MLKWFRPIPSASIRLLVFDLDGTLIDSGADLCASVNAMLRHFGRPPLSDAIIAGYIGDGAPLLVRRALASPVLGHSLEEPFLDQALAFFLDYYRDHKLDQTRVYEGVLAALDALQAGPNGSARPMAVLTNKPVGASQGICDALGLTPYFFRVYGGNSFATKKPDPEGLNTLMREAGVAAGETVMIGDSPVDILTARNAGAWSIGCSYGLAQSTLADAEPDCLLDSATEWPQALLASK
jgi:phosphoglycolate phosphatase